MLKYRVGLLSAALFLSGCSALLFQTLWLRISGLVFGNSVWAAALILSSFMGGLALGNGITGLLRDVPGRPLRLYAGLELVVGLCGSAIVVGLPQVGHALVPAFAHLAPHTVASGTFRFGACFLVLLAPTTAMGMTLPVLVHDPVFDNGDFGQLVAVLYGCNTLGAVIGAVAGELILVERYGLRGTGFIAAAMNGLAAAIAAGFGARSCASRLRKNESSASLVVRPAIPIRLLVISIGSGGLFLALEVIWFRFLRLYVASSATAFSVMLSVVLAGIAIGSVGAAIVRRRTGNAGAGLPGLLLIASAVTLLAYAWFPVPAPHGQPPAFYVVSWSKIAWLAFALMFPTALVSGAIFPVLIAGAHAACRGRMNSTGWVTMSNTVGATTGPILAAFVLLPRFGFQGSLVIAAVGYALLAVVAMQTFPQWSTVSGKAAAAAAIVVAAILAFFPYSRSAMHLADARKPYEADGSRLVRHIDGTADTLQLLRRDAYGQPYYYRLVTNGYSMSATMLPSQRYMRMFAYLPLAFRPQSKDALLICYGVGVTADALVQDRRLRRIDVVDISREVFSLAPDYAGPGYRDPLRDSRVRTVVQDGRFYLQTCATKYDVITGEPPPLKTAGTVNLYTSEFFNLIRNRLKPGGMATFWLPIYQLNVVEAKAILRAFHDTFPDATVWSGPDDEWIMLGRVPAAEPTSPAVADVAWLWSDPATRADLARIGLEMPEQLGAMFVMDGAEIDRITHDVPPLTDNYPRRLGDAPPDVAAVNTFAWHYLQAAPAFQRFCQSAFVAGVWPAERRKAVEPLFIDREIRYDALIHGRNWLAFLDLYLRQSRLRAPVLECLNTDEMKVALAERALSGGVVTSASPELSDLIAAALARRNYAGAIHFLEIEKMRHPLVPNDAYLLTYLYCLDGQVGKANTYAADVLRRLPEDWFSAWLYKKLAADFGFQPPAPR